MTSRSLIECTNATDQISDAYEICIIQRRILAVLHEHRSGSSFSLGSPENVNKNKHKASNLLLSISMPVVQYPIVHTETYTAAFPCPACTGTSRTAGTVGRKNGYFLRTDIYRPAYHLSLFELSDSSVVIASRQRPLSISSGHVTGKQPSIISQPDSRVKGNRTVWIDDGEQRAACNSVTHDSRGRQALLPRALEIVVPLVYDPESIPARGGQARKT